MKHSVLHNDRTHPLNPDESSYVHLTTPWTMLTSLFVWFFYLFMHCWQAYVCTLVIYNQSSISPLNVSTCSYSLAHYGHPQCEYKPPPLHQRLSSIFTQRLFQVQCSISCMCFCWDNLHVYVCLRVFPRAFAAYPQFNSIYDLSLLPLAWNPATLLAPVLPPTLRAAPAAGTVALTLAVTPGATSPSPAAVHTGPISTQAIGWCHLPWPPVSG